MCGFSLGLRGVSAVSAHGKEFHYKGLSREEFPLLMGTWLKQGKFAPFTRVAKPAFPIPALGEGYIPQGMCYSEYLGCFVLAYYYPDGARPSLLALVDADSGECVKQVYLLKPGGMPYTGHAGGAAAWAGHVWVTSGMRAYRLDAGDLRNARDRGTVRFRDSFKTAACGSFAFCADDMLWVGDYHFKGLNPAYFDAQEDPESGNRAWCAGYRLSRGAAQGVAGLAPRSGNSLGGSTRGDAPAPAAMLSIPDHVQGACTASTGELLLSTSRTDYLPADLWVFPSLRCVLAQAPAYEITVSPGGVEYKVPLWVFSRDMALYRQMLAPMSEGVCGYGGDIYAVYESAALKYRENASLYADYVFSIPEGAIIPAEDVESVDGEVEVFIE